ncbi:DNA-binding transcriptional MerR regulator [Nocardia tenerifensis]|uniref:DNA-binding transcriptional MerR regulator n=1 Tax=Nocardia tenerifensis TaxID=228006 RepID=A0A318JYQ7_9NOCA|nr:MerR family transcriptional regulator [Nocardia tenerifensis]PXX60438.1 DNA-binding transcriptional MerR regulator [Nocardia tenerifensis]
MGETQRSWRIGELARETGITVRTLHHYDRLGLLSPSNRTSGGHRCYTEADVRRLHRVIALRSFGFALDTIGAVLDTADQDPRTLILDQLTLVEERIGQAIALRTRLLGVLDGLDRLVEPSATQFLRLIEETITMNQPLTPEQFAELAESRRTAMAQLSADELAALTRGREQAFAALSPQEQQRMREQRRALWPLES